MMHFVLLNALILTLTRVSSTDGSTSLISKCQNDKECGVFQRCHVQFNICVKVNRKVITTMSQESKCKCLNTSVDKSYCHPMFGICLPILTPPKPRNINRPAALLAPSNCNDDRDCVKHKYCHKTFMKCLDILPIPTLSATTKSVLPCKNDSDCSTKQYCHAFFKMCLVKPVKEHRTSYTPHPRNNCTSNAHCQSMQYCHNMTHMCLDKYNLSGIGEPMLSKKQPACKINSDCRIAEFCSYTPQSVPLRHPRRCGNALRCSKFRRRQMLEMGVCVPAMVQFDQHFVNCSRDEECSNGMCCLLKLGTCTKFVQRGNPCVTQEADFICPCSANLYCKPNSRGKMIKGRRLERKLRIARYIRRALTSRGPLSHKKYMYGRCHNLPI